MKRKIVPRHFVEEEQFEKWASEKLDRILDVLKENPSITPYELARRSRIHYNTLRRWLSIIRYVQLKFPPIEIIRSPTVNLVRIQPRRREAEPPLE